MSDLDPHADDGLDQWLADQQHKLITDLAASFDVKAGLDRALILTRHVDLVTVGPGDTTKLTTKDDRGGDSAIAHDMFALLHEAAAPVVTRWSYCTNDPFAVTLEIQTRGNRYVEWVLARELLVAGLSAPAGIGDVRVRPAIMGEWPVTLVEISSPDGHAVLEVDRDLLKDFVQATIDVVPIGSESMVLDMDAEIERIAPTDWLSPPTE